MSGPRSVEGVELVSVLFAVRLVERAAARARAVVDPVGVPDAIEAVVVGHFADQRHDRIGRDRRADAREPHGHLRHLVRNHGERNAIRLAAGDAVGVGDADVSTSSAVSVP